PVPSRNRRRPTLQTGRPESTAEPAVRPKIVLLLSLDVSAMLPKFTKLPVSLGRFMRRFEGLVGAVGRLPGIPGRGAASHPTPAVSLAGGTGAGRAFYHPRLSGSG